MSRPCKLRLQIGGGQIMDMEEMGFHLMESPDIVIPPQRDYETEEYPENDGVKIYPYSAYKSFDYTCTMLFVGDLDSMNKQIRALWAMFFTPVGTKSLRKALEVKIYNDYKNVIITGFATEMPGEETFVEVRKGCWKFQFTILVTDPSKCNFEPGDEVLTADKLPVGYNLRGKTLRCINTNKIPPRSWGSNPQSLICEGNVLGIGGVGMGGDGIQLVAQIETSGIDAVFMYNDSASMGLDMGWLLTEFAIPDDKDYIVEANELIPHEGDGWGFDYMIVE